MTLSYVTLICDLGDGQGNYLVTGTGSFAPTNNLTAATDHLIAATAPVVPAVFNAVTSPPQVKLLATDNADLSPSGWAWTFTPPSSSGLASFSFFLPFSGGATQYLSAQAPVEPSPDLTQLMPAPSGTATAGYVPIATGTGEASAWGPQSGGGGGGVASVTAADTSVVVGGTGTNPTVRTNTLDVIAADHPPAANWSNNSHKITSLSNGSASSDAAAFGQIPTSASAIGGLLATNNLSDLGSASTARTNLGLGAAALIGTPVSIANGGTGQATQQAAINALTGTQAAGDYLRSDGTNATLTTIQPGDVPTLNQNTTGTAANITGTLDQVPHPAANVSMNSHKITSLANGSASTDAAAFGQLPVAATTGTAGIAQYDGTAADITADGNSSAGSNTLIADSGHVHPAIGQWMPGDAGFIDWNYDPALMNSGTAAGNGTLYLVRVNIRKPSVSVTNVSIYLQSAGTSLTANESFAGLYTSGGTLIGATADQSTNWTSGGSTVHTMALSGGPFTVNQGFVWVAIVTNFTGTAPQFGRANNNQQAAANAGFTTSTARWATNGTATSLGTITPGSNTLNQIEWWAALS